MLIEESLKEDSLDEVSREIWRLAKRLRLTLTFSEFAEPILTIAVLAHTDPLGFKNLYKSPVALQRGVLFELVKQSHALEDLVTHLGAEFKHLDAEAVQQLIYFVHEIDDYSAFGDAVVQMLADREGRRLGENHTDTVIAGLMCKLAGDLGQQTVYDGAAGYCSLASHLGAQILELEEVNHAAWTIGKKLMLLKDTPARFSNSNSLLECGTSAQADWVISQPSWSARLSSDERVKLVKAHFLKIPQDGPLLPSSACDALWIQQAIYHLNESGKALLLLPPGWLYRGGYDAKLRQYLLENDLIESIVGLPLGVCYPNSMAPVIVKLNKTKPSDQRGIVRFIDANELGKSVGRRRTLSETDVDLIRQLVNGELPGHESYAAVLLPEIYKNRNNLSIAQYVHRKPTVEVPDLDDELAKLNVAMKNFDEAQKRLLKLIPGN